MIQEKLIMDVLTSSMHSLNFLKNITMAIYDPKLQSLSVWEIYNQWLRKFGSPHVPYSFGVIIGYLYCGILLAKEAWLELLPEVKIEDASPDWGFSSATYSSPQEPYPTVKYAIRRMRNALGHGHFLINVPSDIQKNENDKEDFEKKVTLKFHDENIRTPGDTFDIEISLFGLTSAIKKFHGLAYAHVLSNLE